MILPLEFKVYNAKLRLSENRFYFINYDPYECVFQCTSLEIFNLVLPDLDNLSTVFNGLFSIDSQS